MRKHIWAIAFSVCLVGFTAYLSLDTFAFATVYQEGATEMNTSMFENSGTGSSGSSGTSSSASSAKTASDAAQSGQEATGETSGSSASADQSSTNGSSASSDQSASGTAAASASEGEATSSRGGRSAGKSGRSGKPGSGTTGNSGKPGTSAGGSSGNANASDASTSDASTSSGASDEGTTGSSTPVATAGATSGQSREYSDGNVSVKLSEYTVAGTTVHVADVTVNSAEYLKTAFANDTYGKNVTAATSETAAAHNALLAINGDNYGSRERGYVIRNGVVYRDTADSSDVLCVYADGTLDVVDPSTVSAQQLVEQGVWQAFSFGPALVQDGQVSVSQGDEVGKAKASNPRTAIGMLDRNHYMFVVSDGRTDESEGLSLYELAQFMEQQLGVECAYNLDGGGSSTMVFQGEVVNNPTTNGNRIQERNVNDIVYIG